MSGNEETAVEAALATFMTHGKSIYPATKFIHGPPLSFFPFPLLQSLSFFFRHTHTLIQKVPFFLKIVFWYIDKVPNPH